MVIRAASASGELRRSVAIGASAGGMEALSSLAAKLSSDLPYAYLMTLHIPAGAPSILARIIDRSGLSRLSTVRSCSRHIYVG